MMNIGIFWIYKDTIISKTEELQIDTAKNCVVDIDTGHYEYWRAVQKEVPDLTELAYDVVPRGRVLWRNDKFLVYSSKELLEQPMCQKLIVDKFNLREQKIEFIVDEHYQPIVDCGFENFE